MIPNILYTAHEFQNEIRYGVVKGKAKVSRGRVVTVKNENLAEGLTLFKYDDQNDHYYGIETHTGPLALMKLKALTSSNAIHSRLPKTKTLRGKINTRELPDGMLELLATTLGADFNIAALDDYDIEIKATKKVEVIEVPHEVTSETLEGLFRSGQAYDKDGETLQDNDNNTEDLFLGFVIFEGEGDKKDTLIVDIGELWDESVISMGDIADILSYRRSKNIDVREWADSVGQLSPEQRKAIADQAHTRSRTRVFNDAMHSHNAGFESNRSVSTDE